MSNHHMNNENAAGGMRQMLEMIKQLPRGITSPSGHYWCATCKKMFDIDEPVCPYMPKMCINTPVAVETFPPGSTAFYERAGLFYPKLAQRVLAAAVSQTTEPEALGVAFADDFLTDLGEWNVQYQGSAIETVKSFLIYTAGFDVSTRNTDAGLTFYLVDAGSLWGKDMPAKLRSKTALLAGARHVAETAGIQVPIDLHFMSVMPGNMGRYFCAGCDMFFEFGEQQAQVTCPFMSQKCMFRPKAIGEIADLRRQFDVRLLTKIYRVSPKLYRRQIDSALDGGLDAAEARNVVNDEVKSWGFDVSDSQALADLWQQLGIE